MVYEVHAASVEWNPSTERLRELAEKMPNSQITEFGNLVVKARVDARSTRSTFGAVRAMFSVQWSTPDEA